MFLYFFIEFFIVDKEGVQREIVHMNTRSDPRRVVVVPETLVTACKKTGIIAVTAMHDGTCITSSLGDSCSADGACIKAEVQSDGDGKLSVLVKRKRTDVVPSLKKLAVEAVVKKLHFESVVPHRMAFNELFSNFEHCLALVFRRHHKDHHKSERLLSSWGSLRLFLKDSEEKTYKYTCMKNQFLLSESFVGDLVKDLDACKQGDDEDLKEVDGLFSSARMCADILLAEPVFLNSQDCQRSLNWIDRIIYNVGFMRIRNQRKLYKEWEEEYREELEAAEREAPLPLLVI